jgi:hypothetical protein
LFRKQEEKRLKVREDEFKGKLVQEILGLFGDGQNVVVDIGKFGAFVLVSLSSGSADLEATVKEQNMINDELPLIHKRK